MAKHTALVTGASRGSGAPPRSAYPRRSTSSPSRARRASSRRSQSEIEIGGGVCRTIALDIADEKAVGAALRGLEVDVLVNNAGVGDDEAVPRAHERRVASDGRRELQFALLRDARADRRNGRAQARLRRHDRLARGAQHVRRRKLLRGHEARGERIHRVADARGARRERARRGRDAGLGGDGPHAEQRRSELEAHEQSDRGCRVVSRDAAGVRARLATRDPPGEGERDTR